MEQSPQRPSASAIFGPGFRVLLLISLFFCCGGIQSMLMYIPGLEFLKGYGDDVTVSQMRIANAVGSLLLFAVPALVIANAFPHNRFYWLGLHRRTPVWWLLAAAVIMLAMIFVANPVANWMATLIDDPALRSSEEFSSIYSRQIQLMPEWSDYAACLFLLAFLPALVEELFFRAALLQLLRNWLQNSHVAVWLSAMVFALLHATVAGFPAIFLCGVILGYLFLWTGALRVSIIGHFAFNAFEVTDSFIGQHAPKSWWANWNPGYGVLIAAIVVAAAGLFVLYKNTRNHPDQLL
ncbi:MAG: CPBP family intramembrane metalloprotease [Bacteroidetes bacterium]|nr:CPBP family intramembrane metalloprotease [Bacteroidota bacterium]